MGTPVPTVSPSVPLLMPCVGSWEPPFLESAPLVPCCGVGCACCIFEQQECPGVMPTSRMEVGAEDLWKGNPVCICLEQVLLGLPGTQVPVDGHEAWPRACSTYSADPRVDAM